MYSRKLSSLILGVLGSIVLVVALVSSRDQPRLNRQSGAASIGSQIADGSGPVPPLPPGPSAVLQTDGSGPVPPLPPLPPGVFAADGSCPVPPLPPYLMADGSGPVRPLPPPPPRSPSGIFFAV